MSEFGSCPECGGSGWILGYYGDTPEQSMCQECGGTGIVEIRKEVMIPSGSVDYESLASELYEIRDMLDKSILLATCEEMTYVEENGELLTKIEKGLEKLQNCCRNIRNWMVRKESEVKDEEDFTILNLNVKGWHWR